MTESHTIAYTLPHCPDTPLFPIFTKFARFPHMDAVIKIAKFGLRLFTDMRSVRFGVIKQDARHPNGIRGNGNGH